MQMRMQAQSFLSLLGDDSDEEEGEEMLLKEEKRGHGTVGQEDGNGAQVEQDSPKQAVAR